MKKNNDLFSELIVGVFMVAVIALLAYFTIVISGVDLIRGRERVRATVEFRDVGGLKERDNVVYRGMKVGTVERIALAPEHITVTMLVDRDVVLRDSCRITVAALSLLGGNYLLLEEGKGEARPLETTTFTGVPPADWMRDLGEIARNLNDLTSQGSLKNIVSNFEAMSERLNTVATRVERGEGTLGKLLSTNDQVYVDVAATVASAKNIAGRLERGPSIRTSRRRWRTRPRFRTGWPRERERSDACSPRTMPSIATSRARSPTSRPLPRAWPQAKGCWGALRRTSSWRTTRPSCSRTSRRSPTSWRMGTARWASSRPIPSSTTRSTASSRMSGRWWTTIATRRPSPPLPVSSAARCDDTLFFVKA